MPPCTACRAALLDHLYGLLDPAEAAAVEAPFGRLPGVCRLRQEVERADRHRRQVRLPPGEFSNSRPRRRPPPLGEVRTPGVAALVLAASVLLVAGGWAVLAAFDTVGYAYHRESVNRDLTAVREAEKRPRRRSRSWR